MRSSRSASSHSRWSGFSVKCLIVSVEVCFVVSLPATESSTKNAPISASVSVSPSTSAWMRPVNRSSVGFSRRSAMISAAMACSFCAASSWTCDGSRPARCSGSAQETISCAAARGLSWRCSGTPNIAANIRSGSRLAHPSTNSISPEGSEANESTISRAACSTWSSMRWICFGVKAFWTILRSSLCRGLSIAMNDCVISRNSGGSASNSTPCPETNTSLPVLTVRCRRG